MKLKKGNKRQKNDNKTWLTLFVFLSLVLLLAVVLYKINSPVTYNSEAAGKCRCGDLLCYNGNNIKKAYTESGENGKPQCCFGWPTGRLENVVKNSECIIGTEALPTALPTSPVGVPTAANTPAPNVTNNPMNNESCFVISCKEMNPNYYFSTKNIKKKVVNGISSYYPDPLTPGCTGNPLNSLEAADYCSTSCLAGLVGEGNCQGYTAWKKINENYNPDPKADQTKVLGYYTDPYCKTPYVCNIANTPTPAPVVKSKTVILSNPNPFDLVIVNGFLSAVNGASPQVAWLKEFGLNTFYAGASYTLNLTDNPNCQKEQGPSATYRLSFIYRKADFWNIFSPRTTTLSLPCEQDNFNVNVPLTY